jgi:hypothetical protein
MLQVASAHKSEVFGDYKIEVGWDKEPPLINVDNKITLEVTYAFPEEKEHDTGTISPQDYGKGVTNLEQNLEISVILNKEKTDLAMTEDKENPGLYYSAFTPAYDGYPVVHVVATIGNAQIEADFHPERVEDGALIHTSTPDGTLNASILVTAPEQNRRMLVMAQFTDQQGNLVENVNYDVFVIQGDQVILSEQNQHSEDGNARHTTEIVQSDQPADISLTILGIGLPDEPQNWTGPAGSTMKIHVVPEFGLHAGIVLVSIMGIIVIAARLRLVKT